MKTSMRICIDSNQFIFGLEGTDPQSEALMLLLPDLDVVIPRLVIQEVTRNLNSERVKALYALLNRAKRAVVVEEPVPKDLVARYVARGLPSKADAIIGAFAEWQEVDYLITDNRHFLRNLRAAAFVVLTAAEFLERFDSRV